MVGKLPTEFPFFVNGEMWQMRTVGDRDIRQGYAVIHVTTRPPDLRQFETHGIVEKKVFTLAEMGEKKGPMVANWFSGFWLSDDDVELDEGRLFLKSKDKEGT